MAGDYFFGSSWMPTGSFAPAITETLLDQCVNRDRIYEIVVFDTWVCNIDRHHENLIVRESRGGAPGSVHRSLVLNDHSHCFIRPGETPAILATRVSTPFQPEFVRLEFVRDRISEPTSLKRAVDVIEGMPDAKLATVVGSAPDRFLNSTEKALVLDFLRDRRSQLRRIVTDARGFFPNLNAGPI